MISYDVKIPESLFNKLNKSIWEDCVEDFVDKVGVDALTNVKEYGEGVGAGWTEPFGGAPHWKGKIEIPGHYSGYLSDMHKLHHVDRFHVQIVSSAEFTEGVIEGYSTNWNITFGPNAYHKRAVDRLYEEDALPLRWKSATRGRLR